MAQLLRHTFTKQQIDLIINALQKEITSHTAQTKKVAETSDPQVLTHIARIDEIKKYFLHAHRASISYIQV